jgi:hypothetical protein
MSAIVKLLKEMLALLIYICHFFWGKKRPSADKCVCPPALKKPDPFLYSQQYLTSLGLPVTWDNPDIYIYDGNTLVDPHDLHANTAYTVVARIWNNSPDVPVINLGVNFSFLSFGMGTQSHPIGTTAVDLAAKGLPGCPAFAYMSWTTPATLGHYCLQILLEPPDDTNWLNNLGQRNTDVAQPQSPAVFTFVVGNHVAQRTRNVRFRVDSYTIPPLVACGNEDSVGKGSHTISKTSSPVPPGWNVILAPDSLQLLAGEEKTVQAKITPPSGFHGTMPLNVTGLDDYGLVGGVTLVVEVP